MTNCQKSAPHSKLLVIAFCASIALGCTGQPSESVTPDGPLRVAVELAQSVDFIHRNREFTGTTKAARDSLLSFERDGRLVSITVDEGDAVVAGQLLATIDVESITAQLASAEAQLLQAKSVLDELVAGPRAETIAAQHATVAGLDATVSQLELEFARSEKLLSTSAVSREHFDAKKFGLDAAVAQRDAAARQLDELLAGTRVEQLAAQRATVQQLAATVRSLELDVEDGQLTAPYNGRIVQRMTDEGTVVSTGDEVLRIVEDAKLEVWVGVPVSAAEQIESIQTHNITIGDNSYESKLLSLRAQLDPITRTRNAIFELPTAASQVGHIVPGQIARLAFDEQIEEAGFVVPTSALVPGVRGLWDVFVADPSSHAAIPDVAIPDVAVQDVTVPGNSLPDTATLDTATLDTASSNDVQHDVQHVVQHVVRQCNVELLYTLGEQALVRGTIKEGDLVICDGVHRVVAGQPVSIDSPLPQVAP